MLLLADDLVDIDTIDAVGLGTLILAVATFVLAWVTWRTLKAAKKEREVAEQALAAAQRQAEIAQQTLEAQELPLLINVTRDGPVPVGLPSHDELLADVRKFADNKDLRRQR